MEGLCGAVRYINIINRSIVHSFNTLAAMGRGRGIMAALLHANVPKGDEPGYRGMLMRRSYRSCHTSPRGHGSIWIARVVSLERSITQKGIGKDNRLYNQSYRAEV